MGPHLDKVFYGCDGCSGYDPKGVAVVNEDFDTFDWTSYTYIRQKQ